MSSKFDYLLKFIIIGDSSVGKSNILSVYRDGTFNEKSNPSIGVEFIAKNIEIDDLVFRIQIWDTAGQESFRSITRAYYKNSVCAFIVYDITSRSSFENVKSWLDDIQKQCPQTTFLVLVGNKIDLENERQILYEEGASFAEKNNMLFIETSAKTGQNIENLFLKSVEVINERLNDGYYDLTNGSCGIKKGNDETSSNNNIVLNKENIENNKGGSCCYYF